MDVYGGRGKVLIAGVGRSGTTFLVRLFTLLGADTGFTAQTMVNHIDAASNAGLETHAGALGRLPRHRIQKNPLFTLELPNLVRAGERIELVIVPLRDLGDAASSRARLGGRAPAGGLWGAVDRETQLDFNRRAICTLLRDATQLDVPLQFLDFDRFGDPRYMYKALGTVTPLPAFEEFEKHHATASRLSVPKAIQQSHSDDV